MAEQPRSPGGKKGIVFRRYRWCPRSKKLMDAHDYGHRAWPFRPRRK